MELWQYYRILRKRKWLIIIGTLICVGLIGARLFLVQQKYEGFTTVMEKVEGTEKVVIYSPGYMYQIDPKLRLANLTQLVKSHTVMQRSAETLARMGVTTSPENILSTLSVTPLLDTMILMIKVTSDSATEAKATADVIALEFVKYYNEFNYSGLKRSKEFIESELPKAEQRLNEIREEVKLFKEESGSVSLPTQTNALIQRINQLQLTYATQQIQAEQARARTASVEDQLNALDSKNRVSSKVVVNDPVWQSLEMELVKAEIELQTMLQKRTEEHPEVKALMQKVSEIKSQLDAVADKTVTNSVQESIDPLFDLLSQNYVNALVDHASSRSAAAATEQEIAVLEAELEALPANEMRLAQLTLNEDSARNTYALLRQKYDEATIREQETENLSSVQIVDTAMAMPADTRRSMKLILGTILSVIFCCGMALLLDYLDNTVKTPAQAEELLKLPVFAVVPMARSHSLLDGRHLPPIDTAYQMLSTNLWIGNEDMEGHTVLIASAEPDVGRSMTAANLAVTLAKDGARIILVDSDLRQPSQHKIFKVENESGLSNVLAGQLPLEDALKPTSVTDLLLLPSGPLPANPVRLFRSPEMSKFVSAVNDLADFVIFDSPAGITFADSTLLAALTKNVVMVYAAGTVPRGAEAEFRKRLEQVDANLLGLVLNMVNPEDSHGFYHFRSSYEELMRSGKSMAALASLRASSGTSEEDEQS